MMKTYEELLAERDALAATVRTLKMAIMSNCYDDPSTSGKRLMELANATPTKCLAEIKAEAVKEFAEWAFDTCPNIDCMFDDKDDYIARLRNTGTWLKDSNVNGGKRQGGERC